ncbi:MAG: radical SAM protein [Firmicutes bacterium]|nr:radical SAM protein [Bacillota bacterium]
MSENIISSTRSICPVCGRQLPADRVRRGKEIFLERTCPEHGLFSTVIWRGAQCFFDNWCEGAEVLGDGENEGCPFDCGLCGQHRQDTCCILYEITGRCNLHCPFCFADGGKGSDVPMEKIKEDFARIIKPEETFLQLSGGEPSVRDDLPRIVALAREMGAKYIQLNSNGLRLGEEEAFVKELAEAGLSFVFLQFDGLEEDIYRKLRGKECLALKKRCIENCGKHNIGVTLVPTLVPGVNTHQVGELIRFAAANVPVVRGVHFQPVSFFGRYPQPPKNEDRYTLGELLADISLQTDKMINLANIAPSHCDHPLCGFHSSFIAMEDGTLLPLTTRESGGCCCGTVTAKQNREYIGSRWLKKKTMPPQADVADAENGGEEEDDFDRFLRLSQTRSFTVTAMAFQDAYNLDVERVRHCSLHVYHDGKVYPFCARYLTLAGE